MEITKANLELKSDDYKNFKDQQEKKTNEFTKKYMFFIFAFSENEFQKELDKLGYKKNDIINVGAGGYCLKQNYDLVNEYLDKIVDEKMQYIHKSNENFYGALYYELWNNEYYLSYDNKAVARALGIDASEIVAKYPKANDVVKIYTNEFEKLNL